MCASGQMVQKYQRFIKVFCQKPNNANLLIFDMIISKKIALVISSIT
jgi:hypothetical protein